jgi:hypothetical protein
LKIISFTGSHGVAKSQLAQAFALRTDLRYIASSSSRYLGEYARHHGLIATEWASWNNDHQSRFQLYYTAEIVIEMQKLLLEKSSLEAVVMDRCAWDALAYTYYKASKEQIAKSSVGLIENLVHRVMQDSQPIYTVVLHPDPAYPIEPRPGRLAEDQFKIDEMINEVMFKLPSYFPILHVGNGTLDQKLDSILSWWRTID